MCLLVCTCVCVRVCVCVCVSAPPMPSPRVLGAMFFICMEYDGSDPEVCLSTRQKRILEPADGT